MPFKVRLVAALDERKPGELIKATLVVTDSTGRLENIVRTGDAPLAARGSGYRTGRRPRTGDAGGGRGVHRPDRPRPALLGLAGEVAGRHVRIHPLSTSRLLPVDGPALRSGSAIARRSERRWPAGSICFRSAFDPEYDTPDVLAAHARKVGADPGTWTLLTGERDRHRHVRRAVRRIDHPG